ncbi:hypothetical protein AA23498_2698 [Acetobacter nitrogenifigens DSM 23921 = NBRC 105050]|uniref:Uncharacterized protein n=1 Tax=Acetobacter nitrogenifigens DSM 23921 = NBRC 105050 TaxID=1120919 RepID=A0A511XF04_9PROT|nr:hypothetical protein AA23498_2698 [Acetobacter nitrogenifigens DSM 23921 = NBRC 105050]GEN61481.1 hypothetical protein ANI02nite_33650 [Acetobacter nitrogenifigens DSM 23921 = NBRC 105050]
MWKIESKARYFVSGFDKHTTTLRLCDVDGRLLSRHWTGSNCGGALRAERDGFKIWWRYDWLTHLTYTGLLIA